LDSACTLALLQEEAIEPGRCCEARFHFPGRSELSFLANDPTASSPFLFSDFSVPAPFPFMASVSAEISF